MYLPVLFEFQLTCIPGKRFIHYGNVVFQMICRQITEYDKGALGGVLPPVLFTLCIDVLLNRLEQSGLGYVAHEYFGAMCSVNDLALLAPQFTSLKSIMQISERFAQEFYLLLNAKKTVCILFSGSTRHNNDPPPHTHTHTHTHTTPPPPPTTHHTPPPPPHTPTFVYEYHNVKID